MSAQSPSSYSYFVGSVGPFADTSQAAQYEYNQISSTIAPLKIQTSTGVEQAYELEVGGREVIFSSREGAEKAAYDIAWGGISKEAKNGISIFGVSGGGGTMYFGEEGLALRFGQGLEITSLISNVHATSPTISGESGSGTIPTNERPGSSAIGPYSLDMGGQRLFFSSRAEAETIVPGIVTGAPGGLLSYGGMLFSGKEPLTSYLQGRLEESGGIYTATIGGTPYAFTSEAIGKEFIGSVVSGKGQSYQIGSFTFPTEAEANTYALQRNDQAIEATIAANTAKGLTSEVVTVTPAMLGKHTSIDLGYGPMGAGTYVVGSKDLGGTLTAQEVSNATALLSTAGTPVEIGFVPGLEKNELGNIVGRTTANRTAVQLFTSYGGSMPVIAIEGQATVRGVERTPEAGGGIMTEKEFAAWKENEEFLTSPLGHAYQTLKSNPWVENPLAKWQTGFDVAVGNEAAFVGKGRTPGAAEVLAFPLGLASGFLHVIDPGVWLSDAASLFYSVGHPSETEQALTEQVTNPTGQGLLAGNVAGAVLAGKALGMGYGALKSRYGMPEKVTITDVTLEGGAGEPHFVQEGGRWVVEKPEGFTLNAAEPRLTQEGLRWTKQPGGLQNQPLLPEPKLVQEGGRFVTEDYGTFRGFMKEEITNYAESVKPDVYGFKGTTQGGTLLDIKANPEQAETIFQGKGAFIEKPEIREYFTETNPIKPNLLTEAKEAMPEMTQAPGKISSFTKTDMEHFGIPNPKTEPGLIPLEEMRIAPTTELDMKVIGFATKTSEREEEAWGSNRFKGGEIETARPYASPYEGTPLSETQATKIVREDLHPTSTEFVEGGTKSKTAQIAKELTVTEQMPIVSVAGTSSYAAQGAVAGAGYGMVESVGSTPKTRFKPAGISTSAFSMVTGLETAPQFKTMTKPETMLESDIALKEVTSPTFKMAQQPALSQVMKPSFAQPVASAVVEEPAFKLRPSQSFIQTPVEVPAYKVVQTLTPATGLVTKTAQKTKPAPYLQTFSAMGPQPNSFIFGPQRRRHPAKALNPLGAKYWEDVYKIPKLNMKANTGRFFTKPKGRRKR